MFHYWVELAFVNVCRDLKDLTYGQNLHWSISDNKKSKVLIQICCRYLKGLCYKAALGTQVRSGQVTDALALLLVRLVLQLFRWSLL